MPQTRSATSPAPQDRLLKPRRGEFVLPLDPLAPPASSSVVPTKQASQSVSLVRIGLDEVALLLRVIPQMIELIRFSSRPFNIAPRRCADTPIDALMVSGNDRTAVFIGTALHHITEACAMHRAQAGAQSQQIQQRGEEILELHQCLGAFAATPASWQTDDEGHPKQLAVEPICSLQELAVITTRMPVVCHDHDDRVIVIA